jgi:hypothetical protein
MTHVVHFVADVNAYTGVEEETLRISTHSFATGPFDAPPNVQYMGIVSDVGVIDRAIFEGTATLGNPSSTQGYIEIANAGALDAWINYGFDGRQFIVYRMMHEQFAAKTTLFTGTLLGLDTSNAWTKLRFVIRDRLRELDQPLLTERYLGTTLGPGEGIEGTADLKDQIKPWVVGSARNVTPKFVNPFDLIYQVSKHAVTVIIVKVGGQNVNYWGDAGTLSELENTVIGPTQYATCLAEGIFRMGFSSDAVITCDVVEESRTTAGLALAVLQEFGVTDIDTDSFSAADAFNISLVGINLDSDESVLSIVSRILDSAGFALIPDLFGEYRVAAIRDPVGLTVIQDFDINDIKDGASIKLRSGVSTEGEGIPAYSIVYHYDVNYTPLTNDQLAGILSEEDKVPLLETRKTTTVENVGILEQHPLAVQLTKTSLFLETTDAVNEASRLLDLYSVRRDRVDVTLHDVKADGVELGDCVRLTLDRFGYDSGKKFIVLGRRDEFRTRSVTLSLWG